MEDALVKVAERDASKPAGAQSLPNLPREALIRIEQSEKDAREIYDRDKVPYFPMNPEFSFLETSIFRSISHIVDYVHLFAEAVLDSHLKEYLEYAPSDLLTNESLLRSLELDIWTLTDELWNGYGQILQCEPTSRRARYGIAAARGTIDQHPELEPWLYPDSQQWAAFISRMAEADSEMARLSKRYTATVKLAINDRIRNYQRQAASKLQVKPEVVQTSPEGTNQGGRALLPEDTPNEAKLAQPEAVKVMLRKRGDIWEIGYDGKTSIFQDIKGFHFISRLLREPWKEIMAGELAARVNPVSEAVANEANLTSDASSGGGFSIRDSLGVGGAGNIDEVLDETALKEYRERLSAIVEERKEAEENHDSARLATLNEEVERIGQEINAATGHGGKVRKFVSPDDRARSNVTMQIKAAIRKISAQNPDLGSHLGRAIKTGMRCSYQPDPTTDIDWIL